ncbi:follicle-stimulating hormone receptor-like [Frankliniella occidentalis]|uniref:Follicle-stimulating hormone receptor-like n=1 Tax=Frankliniella occidentalis TaxID=133901 RepID=A0A9C6TPJ7_FRAOC|nr:follicle-stimulating hormone receptor-like [Frankliniella occidentalis]
MHALDPRQRHGCGCDGEKTPSWADGASLNCSCSGLQLLSIPPALSDRPIRSLLVQSAGMQILKSSDLNCCRRDLQELTLEDLKNLTHVENGILQDMSQLRSLAMYRLTSLNDIPKEVFETHLPRLRILRIIHSGIRRIPPLNLLGDQILEMVSLKGNANLRFLHPDAFQGIDSLRRLDLSRTAITRLPTRGLENLEHLLLQDTHLLKVFPAAFHFKALQAANLTYPYHCCCAFSHPAAHRPEEYASYQEKLREVQARCSELNTSQVMLPGHRRPRGTGWEDLLLQDADETFHQDNVTLLPGVLEAVCGDLARPRPPVSCSPAPDAFSPCEDLMGNWLLRLAVWLVSVAALLGNGAVLVVLLSPRRRLSVPRFLMCHLAAADLAMGAYLLMLAVMDAVSVGSYFNYAIDWQNGE